MLKAHANDTSCSTLCRTFVGTHMHSLHFFVRNKQVRRRCSILLLLWHEIATLFVPSDQTEKISCLVWAAMCTQTSYLMQMAPLFKCNAGKMCNGLDQWMILSNSVATAARGIQEAFPSVLLKHLKQKWDGAFVPLVVSIWRNVMKEEMCSLWLCTGQTVWIR